MKLEVHARSSRWERARLRLELATAAEEQSATAEEKDNEEDDDDGLHGHVSGWSTLRAEANRTPEPFWASSAPSKARPRYSERQRRSFCAASTRSAHASARLDVETPQARCRFS